MQLKNDLWDFTLKFYQQPDVEQSCLALQNQYGLSINRLIYACWCSCRGLRQQQGVVDGAADQWQAEITHPLRQLRYMVRKEKSEQDALEPCYLALRKAELACEQVELALLYKQSSELAHAAASLQLLEENLTTYLHEIGVERDETLEHLLTPLIQAVQKQINLV